MRVYLIVEINVTSPLQNPLPFDRPPVFSKSIRRCVRRVRMEPESDGAYHFRARSFTRRNGVVHHCRVNPDTGFVWCSCKDFLFRHADESPTIWNGRVCKHLRRAIRTVRRVERDNGFTDSDTP